MGANVSSESSFDAIQSGFAAGETINDPASSHLNHVTESSELSSSIKSKSRTLASTIHRHLTRKSTRNSKHVQKNLRVFREFLSVWPTAGLLQLVSQYEAIAVLRELHLQAESARTPLRSVADDLFDLLHDSHCADIQLQFGGHSFAVHKALICARCPLFRKMLSKVYDYGATVPLELPQMPQLTIDLFERLLQYVYTGRWSITAATIGKSLASKCKTTESNAPSNDVQQFNVNKFERLPEEWLLKLHLHVPNELNKDLKHLLDTGLYSDATLVFVIPQATDPATDSIGCIRCDPPVEYSCHMAVLAARSRFFRSAIKRELRRMRGSETPPSQASTSSSSSSSYRLDTTRRKVRIVLDDRFVPRRFARVILHSLYQDGDFWHILTESTGPHCESHQLSRSESHLGDLFELYHLARLLEIDSLARQSEDLLLNKLNMQNALAILRWTRNGFGSVFVRRQLIQMLRDQFTSVSETLLLNQLSANELFEIISSDFVQASELELLEAIVRWGEHKLFKKMQESEPNLVSQTAHSIRRYNTKTKFNDAQLKQLIDPLLTLIRFDHILPQPNDFLISLQNRQLIGWPNQLHFDDFNALPILSGEGLNSVDSGKEFEGIDSSKALTNRTLNLTASANGFTTTGQSNAGLANHAVIEHLASQIQHWIPSGNAPLNRKPRLFFVYYEEAKSLLEERVGRPGEMINTLKSTVSIHRSHSTSNEPSLPLVSLFSSTCNSSPSTSANCPFHSNTNRAFEDAQCIGDTASEDGEIGGQHRFLCGSLSNSTGAQMPDTLYMVQSSNRWSINEDQLMPANRSHASYRGSSIDERRSVCSNLSDTSSNRLSIVTHELINSSLSNNQFDCTFADAAAINRSILHGSSKSIDPLSQVLIQSLPADRIVQLKQREQNLRTLAIANRHLSALEDKSFFYHLIALRVVREFGLDDCLTVIFRPETLVSIGTGNNFRNRTSSATHSSQLPQPSQSTSSSLTSARHSSTGRTRNTSQLPNEAFAFDSEFDVALDEMDDAVFALSTLNRTVDAARRARQDHLKCV